MLDGSYYYQTQYKFLKFSVDIFVYYIEMHETNVYASVCW
jgi:hypothetical protein